MRTESVDEDHEAALGENFDRDVAGELIKLAKENAGERAVFVEVIAKAAFWLRVYGEMTDKDPLAGLALAELVGKLRIGLIDAKRMN